ncbi:protein phosphatase 1H [Stomoxys calcitrans]|uniref:protein phosphatase 1H n=1 Tax=Stomoxys calcitrans TaxID=35570 RepID=UPI0027E36136|nr:protein phosphatase 1H [Stomoxys calcitrans]XP_013111893.2 protein phosphatase 1H [Stomoxys calcitrans]XP_013111894.2 protein phosphatase 1H [Stomoxys calcitrans]
MFANIKSRFLATVIAPDLPALPSSSHEHLIRGSAAYHQRMLHQQQLQDKFAYARPPFLQLLTADELKASADHNVRPIIVPRDINMLPWGTGYAECVNSGKSEWNEDQGAFCRQILSDPTHQYPDLPYTYFGIFDGHAGYGAALAASHQFHHILHEKLVDCIELLLPREGMEDAKVNVATQSVNSFPHPSHFQRIVSKDELIMGALESAFVHMDSLIAQDRDRYRDAGGCTACVSLFINGKMYVANAGDSRAVLCQRKVLSKEELPATTDGSEGAFPVPFSFDHTPETERTRLLGVAQYKPHLMGKFYTAMEYAKRPHERDLGQRILCRQGTMKGWTYKTLTREDLKMPVVTGEGKRSRLLGTLGVTRGFGDHDLLAIATGTLIKPFLTAQPEVMYRDLTKIVTIPEEQNEDGDYGILVMATDGLWDVSENEAVARTVFQTLHKYPTEKHRYTMVAQELVAKARGKINEYGHWRLADSKAAATVDDISVIVIPVHQYYKEHIEWEQKCLREYRERLERERAAQAVEAKEEVTNELQQYQQQLTKSLVNGMQEMEMAQVEIEPVLNVDDDEVEVKPAIKAMGEMKIEEKSPLQAFIENEKQSTESNEKSKDSDSSSKVDKELEDKEEQSQAEEKKDDKSSLETTTTEQIDSTSEKTSPSKSKQRKNQRKDKR